MDLIIIINVIIIIIIMILLLLLRGVFFSAIGQHDCTGHPTKETSANKLYLQKVVFQFEQKTYDSYQKLYFIGIF